MTEMNDLKKNDPSLPNDTVSKQDLPSACARMPVRTALAVAACRLSRAALHGLGRGGTALPGRLAMRFRGDILSVTSRGVETVLVTGTNGKTTTAGMLAHAMEKAGRPVICNRAGANLLSGVTAEFAAAADLCGRPRGKQYAVIECDEGALHQAAPLVQPRVIVVTNLFRDQLDRYGEVMHTREAILEGIRSVPGAVLCLNADDSLTASIALEVPNPVVWYGIEQNAVCRKDGPEDQVAEKFSGISDARCCIRCGAEYTYRYRTYAHLGGYCCPTCGFARPVPDVAVTAVDECGPAGSRVRMRMAVTAVNESDAGSSRVCMRTPEESSVPATRSGEFSVRIALPALYNVYNAAAAVSAYTAAGLPRTEILAGLADVRTGFGRMERFEINGVSIQMILVKNPAGCGQALDYLFSLREACRVVLCLNDRDADGHDISWIWDVDYEQLAGQDNIRGFYVWGDRAEDMQLRLKYAGIDQDRIRLIPEKEKRRLLARISRGRTPVQILTNYTAMLSLRDLLRRAAGKEAFWKG
jgi:UDP-N-acetylmuramyl tripeptide synthase